jgi:diphthine-ammonia ligase
VSGNEVEHGVDEDEQDLNSFMYQTVGHQVIPLYAEATGIPLYRRAIAGGATQHGKEYSHYGRPTSSGPGTDSVFGGHPKERALGLVPKPDGNVGSTISGADNGSLKPEDPITSAASASAGQDARGGHDTVTEDPDETESMVPLLQAIKAAHPEANAICAGAILSTYQRTRVVSVATRLGLTPLAYLWKFPVLPAPAPSDPAVGSDAQLLDDMAATGLEARIIKVASGGLDDSFLWTNVASAGGKGKLARAMRRFGTADTGAVIGEGGEFETLVLDGPPSLFKKRIVVAEEDQRIVREGGGSAWLSLRNARLEDKGESGAGGSEGGVRIPDLLDAKLVGVLDALSFVEDDEVLPLGLQSSPDGEQGNSLQLGTLQASASETLQHWSFATRKSASIEAETQSIVEQIRQRLQQHSLPPSAILSATIILRRMADFPAVNNIYGTLFDAPNPPSRVTISCGDALSTATDAGIAVHLTVHTALQPDQRHGLHVQSRSYWAPANIGPYSQAISIPVASLGSSNDTDNSEATSGPRLVSIAGQIPLVPATMTLPVSSDSRSCSSSSSAHDNLDLQLTLSLQHLWRIAIEMGVQWWTSAVAFFPRSTPEGMDMALRVKLAARAWKTAHISKSDEEEEDDDETGPDLWDRRFNPQYMSLAGDGQDKKPAPALPDQSVLSPTSSKGAPPLFVAEVDELPRAAGVEWQGHLGVARALEGGIVLRHGCCPVSGEGVAVSQVVVRDETGMTSFVQTVVAERFTTSVEESSSRCREVGFYGQVAKEALAQLGKVSFDDVSGEPAAVVRYVDAEVLKASGECAGGVDPVVPCRSLWNDKWERLVAVTVYHSVFKRGN